MKMNKIKLAVCAICVTSFLPFVTEASSAIQLSPTTALFSIDFGMEADGFAAAVPIAAKHGVTYKDRVDYLGYTVVTKEDSDVTITNLNAIVLSKSTIEGVRYQVPKDTKGSFTLFILATFSEPLSSNEYQAVVTKLPYWYNGARTTVHQNQLDELAQPTLKIK